MYGREIIWELFQQKTWQGGQGKLSFSIEHKPLIEMSLAQCCEDQLMPINQAGSQGEFPWEITMRFLPFLGRSCPGTGPANNHPPWHSKAWNTFRTCLSYGEKVHWLWSFQLLQALAVNCFSTFPSSFSWTLSRWDVLELFPRVPRVPLDLLCLQSVVCVCCTQIPAMDQEI